YLSQPTISVQIQTLEEELNTKLFDRLGKEALLTKSGKILYRHAIKIFKQCKAAQKEILELDGLITGDVSLGASNIPGEYILPPLLGKFYKEYPEVKVDLIIRNTFNIIDRILNNEIEVGMVGEILVYEQQLKFEKFYSERLFLAVPLTHKWAGKDTINLDMLKEEPYISREFGSGTKSNTMKKLLKAGWSEKDLNIVLKVSSNTAVKKAVEAGIGVSILSELSLLDEVKLGTLHKLDIKGMDMERTFYLVHHKNKSKSKAMDALLNFLQKNPPH
ncbi:MAG: selenium metabolism-associated LysR family transcriptional regulator, partial [Thermodesulfobacteriota bacterium]|nr:selenium metabolism-associated LysR family transcriptional regulator [Thermodesulfobacteriota bacterium]